MPSPSTPNSAVIEARFAANVESTRANSAEVVRGQLFQLLQGLSPVALRQAIGTLQEQELVVVDDKCTDALKDDQQLNEAAYAAHLKEFVDLPDMPISEKLGLIKQNPLHSDTPLTDAEAVDALLHASEASEARFQEIIDHFSSTDLFINCCNDPQWIAALAKHPAIFDKLATVHFGIIGTSPNGSWTDFLNKQVRHWLENENGGVFINILFGKLKTVRNAHLTRRALRAQGCTFL